VVVVVGGCDDFVAGDVLAGAEALGAAVLRGPPPPPWRDDDDI
jgi:hypothetical protein